MMTRSSRYPDLLFGLVLVACMWMLFALHYYAIGRFGRIQSALADTLLDSLVLSLPFFVVPGRWRRMVWVVLPLFTIIFEVNALYFRNFDALPGLGALFSGNPFNGFAMRGAVHSLLVADLLMLLPAAVCAAAWAAIGGRRICAGPWRWRIAVAAMVLWIAVPPVRYALTVRRTYYWNQAYTYSTLREYFSEMTEIMAHTNDVRLSLTYYGFVPYIRSVVDSAIPHTHHLSEEDQTRIRRFFASQQPSEPIEANRGKNLILLIVESLNSTALYTAATPFMNSLMGDSTSFVAPSLRELVGTGRSADGQFMYNTGLLPLRSEALVFRYADAPYPSLAKCLGGYYAIEVIGEDARVWNHDVTTRSYGYRRMVDNAAPDGLDADRRIMQRAAALLDSIPQPFVMEITSISMHEPYNAPAVSNRFEGYDGSATANYLAATLHFDNALREFFDTLRSRNLLHNCIIAIVGDHCARPGALSPELTCHTVPLIIANAGADRRVFQGEASQVDVFPTLLDVMGVAGGYRGVGRSLVAADSIAQPGDEAWQVSEMIIRSRCAASGVSM